MEWIPLFWLLLAVLLIIIESISFNLISTWFAIGALAAMIVSLVFPEAVTIQIFVFLGVSVLILVTIRDFFVKKLKTGVIKTNVNSLIGKRALVTQQIEPFKNGEVKVDGNYWTAKSLNEDIILINQIVEIVEVSGVKLIVKILDKQ